MTDTEMTRRKAICSAAGVNDIGEVSDGFHTFNGLYEQRMILFAALVKAYKSKAWKSYRHEDGEYCFGGGWFVVGIDTPEGNYTYHYENKYWDMFDCIDLPRAPHWDGHTEADAETRLMSLEPEIKTEGDTISRQAAIDVMFNFHVGHGRRYAEIDLEEFDALPSVHPEPMTARLEPLQTTTIYESGETFTAGCLSAWVCDNCKAIYNTKPSTKKPDFDFCPRCGAKFLKDGEW